jgi:hypothetical protein
MTQPYFFSWSNEETNPPFPGEESFNAIQIMYCRDEKDKRINMLGLGEDVIMV